MYKHSFCDLIIKKQFEFLNKLIKQKFKPIVKDYKYSTRDIY